MLSREAETGDGGPSSASESDSEAILRTTLSNPHNLALPYAAMQPRIAHEPKATQPSALPAQSPTSPEPDQPRAPPASGLAIYDDRFSHINLSWVR